MKYKKKQIVVNLEKFKIFRTTKIPTRTVASRHNAILLPKEAKTLESFAALFQSSGQRSGIFRNPQTGISCGIRQIAEARPDSAPMFMPQRLGIRAIRKNTVCRTKGTPYLFLFAKTIGSHPSSTPRMIVTQYREKLELMVVTIARSAPPIINSRKPLPG